MINVVWPDRLTPDTGSVGLAVARRAVEQDALLGRLAERAQLLALLREHQHVAIDQRPGARGQNQLFWWHRCEAMNADRTTGAVEAARVFKRQRPSTIALGRSHAGFQLLKQACGELGAGAAHGDRDLDVEQTCAGARVIEPHQGHGVVQTFVAAKPTALSKHFTSSSSPVSTSSVCRGAIALGRSLSSSNSANESGSNRYWRWTP